MKKISLASLLIAGLPLVTFAADIDSVIRDFDGWVNYLTGTLAALALLVFFWGVVKYIAAAGNEKAKEQGQRVMTGGVIALFVLFSVFGIVRFLQNSFDIQGSNQNMRPPEVIL
jgi:hypothetical protein